MLLCTKRNSIALWEQMLVERKKENSKLVYATSCLPLKLVRSLSFGYCTLIELLRWTLKLCATHLLYYLGEKYLGQGKTCNTSDKENAASKKVLFCSLKRLVSEEMLNRHCLFVLMPLMLLLTSVVFICIHCILTLRTKIIIYTSKRGIYFKFQKSKNPQNLKTLWMYLLFYSTAIPIYQYVRNTQPYWEFCFLLWAVFVLLNIYFFWIAACPISN